LQVFHEIFLAKGWLDTRSCRKGKQEAGAEGCSMGITGIRFEIIL